MNLYRVIASVTVKHSEWMRTAHPPTFYVHGTTVNDARHNAISLLVGGVIAPHTYRTSGSIVQVDVDLDPVGGIVSWRDEVLCA